MHNKNTLAVFFFVFLITSCHPIEAPPSRRVACNILRSEIVFNGSTSDTRRAEIQKAEAPLQELDYDANNC